MYEQAEILKEQQHSVTVWPESAMCSRHHLSYEHPLGTSFQTAEPVYLNSLHLTIHLVTSVTALALNISLCAYSQLLDSPFLHISLGVPRVKAGRLRPAQAPLGSQQDAQHEPPTFPRSSSALPIWGTFISSVLQIGGWR